MGSAKREGKGFLLRRIIRDVEPLCNRPNTLFHYEISMLSQKQVSLSYPVKTTATPHDTAQHTEQLNPSTFRHSNSIISYQNLTVSQGVSDTGETFSLPYAPSFTFSANSVWQHREVCVELRHLSVPSRPIPSLPPHSFLEKIIPVIFWITVNLFNV